MKFKQFVLDGLGEASRQLFGVPRRKRKAYKYILTLSEPLPESKIIKEVLRTGIDKYFLKIKKYGYGWK